LKKPQRRRGRRERREIYIDKVFVNKPWDSPLGCPPNPFSSYLVKPLYLNFFKELHNFTLLQTSSWGCWDKYRSCY